jgi:MFS family permease
VSGLEELQGGSGFDFRLLFPVAIVLGGLFVWHERRSSDPLIDPSFFRSRNLRIALLINLLVGAALIIAMVDVPIFVNAIEINLERSAVVAGWILAALTAAMAIASWVGGRLAERYPYRTPTAIGMAAASIALLVMGLTWSPDLSYAFGAAQLALLGAGLGLVFAPTTATVVDASPPSQRGAAAAIVMIVRLVGLSVGLAALTAWGLGRFNELRQNLELPSITDPGFQEAITEASARLTADAISETFLAASAVTAVGVIIALFARSTQEAPMAPIEEDDDTSPAAPTWIPAALAVLAIGLIGALIGLAIVVSSLNDTKDELAQTRLDLVRIEEGAAGSAIVSAQVLEISRQIAELEPQISEGLDAAIIELENFSNSSIEFNVAVDETIVIDTEITIDRDFSFPIDETITIDEILPINQTVDTTIEIDTGLGFKVPVNVTVPVNVDVPVKVDVPINLDVEVPINETVPVQAEVPINLNVPIEVNIAETDLKVLADQLAQGLRNVQAVVGDLVG